MNRNARRLSRMTEEYLREEGIPYLKMDDSINLILLKNNSTCHYCAVEFFDVEDEWYNKKKPFKFKRIWGNTIQVIMTRINQYIAE